MTLIDPDCRDGKCGSCVGGPCEHDCHEPGSRTTTELGHPVTGFLRSGVTECACCCVPIMVNDISAVNHCPECVDEQCEGVYGGWHDSGDSEESEDMALHVKTKPKRVLVTGSRDWGKGSSKQRETLQTALRDVFEPGAVLVSGACPTGADSQAEYLWNMWGGEVERHPADWRVGRSAGPKRNRRMVESGADICLAFIRNGSRGASGCAEMAEDAGIPTHRYTEKCDA